MSCFWFEHVVPDESWFKFLPCLELVALSGRRCSSICLPCTSLAQLLFICWEQVLSGDTGPAAPHGLCTPARESCTVYQVDLFTVREKQAKCLVTGLRGRDISLPVVLENYRHRFILLANRCLNCWRAFKAIPVPSRRAKQGLVGPRMCCWNTYVCLWLNVCS